MSKRHEWMGDASLDLGDVASDGADGPSQALAGSVVAAEHPFSATLGNLPPPLVPGLPAPRTLTAISSMNNGPRHFNFFGGLRRVTEL